MVGKFGCCAFTHPLEDLKPSLRIAAFTSEPVIIPPEMWIARLSTVNPAAILHEKLVDCQRVRLVRHNCETEIGWSCVLTESTDSGVCTEGLVASCCVGLPQDAAADWLPPTYDMDTHRHASVFKQVSSVL
jgi:hypothetical protein